MYKTTISDNKNRTHLFTATENFFITVLFNRLMRLFRFVLYHFYNVCVHIYIFSV